MSGIADLIERLEKAEGPDRDTDADIYIAFNIPAERAGRIDRLGGCVGWWPKDAPYVSAVDVPSYTASLDAATTLVERVLPGWGFYLRSDKGGHGCGLTYPNALRVTPRHCEGATPAIAIVLAALSTLRALAEQEDRR